MNSPQNSCLYEFEGYVLDPLRRVLRTGDDGQMVHLSARAFDALNLLVECHGHLVQKETLIKALWPKVVVEENNLTQIIHSLRQALGEKPGENRFIATAPGRGYQFVATVRPIVREVSGPAAVPNSAPKSVTMDSASAWPTQSTTSPAELATEEAQRDDMPSRSKHLKWGTLAVALLLMAGAWWMADRKDAPVATPQSSVAVLPFINLTGDASRDYLGEGMAEELINALTRVPGLKVPARTSSFSYKGRDVDARQIARELGVGTIVEGSVRSAGENLRITAQLINAADGLHLWSETYDEQFTDIFKLQDKLAREIATALHANLGAGAVAIANKPPTQDVDAYRLYLQGTALLERPTLPNVQLALELFQQAIDHDATFARAYEGVANGQLADWTSAT